MRNASSVGAGSLLPSAAKVKNKNQEISAASDSAGTPSAPPDPAAVTRRVRTYKTTIRVPATAEHLGIVFRINLSAEETARVQAIADLAGLSLDKLVRSYLKRETNMKERRPVPEIPAGTISVAPSMAPETRHRLERAAAMYGESVEQYIGMALACHIEGAEDGMLFHPDTGELLGGDDLCDLVHRDKTFTPDTTQARGVVA